MATLIDKVNENNNSNNKKLWFILIPILLVIIVGIIACYLYFTIYNIPTNINVNNITIIIRKYYSNIKL